MKISLSMLMVLSLAGCVAGGAGSSNSAVGVDGEEIAGEAGGGAPGSAPGAVGEGCHRWEGDEIGADGLSVTLGGVEVSISSWVPKDGEESEYVGFAVSSTGSVSFIVKAGIARFEGSGASWLHPAGTSGPSAQGISYVEVCVPGASGGGETEDDGTPKNPIGSDGTSGVGEPGGIEVL